jgi:hypothetical protein
MKHDDDGQRSNDAARGCTSSKKPSMEDCVYKSFLVYQNIVNRCRNELNDAIACLHPSSAQQIDRSVAFGAHLKHSRVSAVGLLL